MGCRFGKPPAVDVDIKVRREETCKLLAELRSLGIASWPPPALVVEESRPYLISFAVAGAPELKGAISKNPGLLSFVNDHLDHAFITTLRSLTDVKGYLDKVQVILSTVRVALECFEEEKAKRRNDEKKKKESTKKYTEAVEKLKELRAVGDPFAGLNTDGVLLDRERQLSLLALLRRRNHELERRLRSVKKWRKAWNVIYMAAVVAVLAWSVMLAAVASPAAVIAGATASATAMKSAKPCIDWLWDEREGSWKHEKDVMAAMQREGGLAVHGLDNVRSMVEKLKIDFDAMLEDVDFVISGEEAEMAVKKIGMEHLMAKKGEVDKGIDSLKEKLDSFDGGTRKATTKFLEIIMKDGFDLDAILHQKK